jgi:hypothetical protein
MPKKPSGGRGKRESYSTSVVRVPGPIKREVLFLIEQFHRKGKVNKPVTGLNKPLPRHKQLNIEDYLEQLKREDKG